MPSYIPQGGKGLLAIPFWWVPRPKGGAGGGKYKIAYQDMKELEIYDHWIDNHFLHLDCKQNLFRLKSTFPYPARKGRYHVAALANRQTLHILRKLEKHKKNPPQHFVPPAPTICI